MTDEHAQIPTNRPEYAIRLEDGFARLGIGRTTGYRLIREGKLPTIRVYGRRLLRVADLEEFVAALTED